MITNSDAKGKGFVQPLKPHEHWHVDVAYLNIAGTFYYLCSLLDGCSRYIVHWEIREAMTEADVEQIVQRARERFPGVTPRIISDNGPQFVAKDFKEFIRVCGMTHVKTSPLLAPALWWVLPPALRASCGSAPPCAGSSARRTARSSIRTARCR